MSCRLTLIGSRRRVDAALPAAVPVAELIPDVLDLLGESVDGAAVEWGLLRTGGRPLDLERSLADQGVEDGSMLFLHDLASAPSAPLIEDYAEQVAVAVDAQPGRWDSGMAAALLVAAGAATAVAAGLLELAAGDARSRAVLGGVGVLVVTAGAVAVIGVLRRRLLATVLVLSGLPLWAAAGTGVAGLGHASALPMLASALGAIALGALVAIVIAGDEALSPGAGILAATLIPTLVSAAAAVFGASVQAAAALMLPLFLGALALTAPATVRLAGISTAGLERLDGRLAIGRQMMASLLAGASLAIAASCVVLAASGQWPAWLLVGVAAVAAGLRARHFRFAAEIVPLVAAALIGLIALELPLAMLLAFTPHGTGDLAALLIADAALLVLAVVVFTRWEIPQALKPWLDRLEVTAIAASVPLALFAMGAFDAAARFARGLV